MKIYIIRIFTIAVWLSFALGLMNVAHAHELKPTVADIDATEDVVTVTMQVNLEALITEIGAEHTDTDESENADRYNQLRALPPEELTSELNDYLPSLLGQLSLSGQAESENSGGSEGEELELSLLSSDIPAVGDIRIIRDSTLVLQAERPSDVQTVSWNWAEQYGPIILRADATGESGEAFAQYLQAGDTSDLIAIEAGAEQTSGSGFFDYVVIGFEHIIPKGLDHILFVIGLFLLAPRLKPIAWQVSTFTIAHTATLALAITGVVTLSAQIVEPLIALSIAIVCIENLFGQRFRTSRLITVFAFGLLHGLGFAGVLSDIGLPEGRFVSSLLAFNIGVEIGQLTVVLACFALVGWWFGARSWYRKVIVIPGSLAIGAVGLFWFVQRLGLI